MQNELIFTTNPKINPKGFNQYVKILAIQEKTYQHRFFESMSECNKSTGAGIREISRISIRKLYTCAKGWTFIRANDETDIIEEIKQFQQSREKLNVSVIPSTKICYKCGIEKPFNSAYFHKGKSSSKYGKLRFKGVCKECRKGEHKNDYANIKYRISNSDDLKAKFVFQIYRKIDKIKGIYFDLTKEWISENIIHGECYYCGFTDNIGIDRINNNIGHIVSNCIPCCKICNITRMDNFTHEEFKKLGIVIRQIKNERNGFTAKQEIDS